MDDTDARAPGVLITGGASGIGRAAVERFLDDGWGVVAADFNEQRGAELLADLAEAHDGGRLAFVRADVAREQDVAAAVALVAERHGRLDCIVNNAGVGGAFGPVTEIEVEDWDYTFDVLVRGVFLGVKHGGAAMRADGLGGAIVNTASTAGLVGGMGPHAYSAAKAAVISLTRTAAVELAPSRVRVNAISPGAVLTPLFGDPGQIAEGTALRAALPWPDPGRPVDIANVMAFLASPQAAYITGETITVDGGLVAAGPRIAHGDVLPVVGVNRGSTGERATVRRKVRP